MIFSLQSTFLLELMWQPTAHDIEKLVARVRQPDLALDKEINNLWTK